MGPPYENPKPSTALHTWKTFCLKYLLYILTYLHTCILTYFSYLNTYILTYLHAYLPTSILTYHTYILTYFHTYILSYLHICMRTIISTYPRFFILSDATREFLFGLFLHTYTHIYIPQNHQRSTRSTAARAWHSTRQSKSCHLRTAKGLKSV